MRLLIEGKVIVKAGDENRIPIFLVGETFFAVNKLNIDECYEVSVTFFNHDRFIEVNK